MAAISRCILPEIYIDHFQVFLSWFIQFVLFELMSVWLWNQTHKHFFIATTTHNLTAFITVEFISTPQAIHFMVAATFVLFMNCVTSSPCHFTGSMLFFHSQLPATIFSLPTILFSSVELFCTCIYCILQSIKFHKLQAKLSCSTRLTMFTQFSKPPFYSGTSLFTFPLLKATFYWGLQLGMLFQAQSHLYFRERGHCELR